MVDKLHSAALRDARRVKLLSARCLTMHSYVKSGRVTVRTILEINNVSDLCLVPGTFSWPMELIMVDFFCGESQTLLPATFKVSPCFSCHCIKMGGKKEKKIFQDLVPSSTETGLGMVLGNFAAIPPPPQKNQGDACGSCVRLPELPDEAFKRRVQSLTWSYLQVRFSIP